MRSEIFDEIKKSRENYLRELLRPLPPEPPHNTELSAEREIRQEKVKTKVKHQYGVAAKLIRYFQNLRTVIIPEFFELSKE